MIFLPIIFYFLLWPGNANSEDKASFLKKKYGISLQNLGDERDWSPWEVSVVLETLKVLPPKIAEIAKKSIRNSLSISKSYQTDSSFNAHISPWFLTWQSEVNLAEAQHLATKINSLTKEEKKQYKLYLQRKITHLLLHEFDKEHDLSTRSKWRYISGWRYIEFLWLRSPIFREPLNQDRNNYTRESALESPQEDFASFGEFYFFKNPSDNFSIKCKIPDKFNFFREHFPNSHSIHSEKCTDRSKEFYENITFLDSVTKKPISLGRFSPDTVEGFELLYATPGVNDAAEIAGHLILRVKLKNNPEAELLGIENPNDLVISFLADTRDLYQNQSRKEQQSNDRVKEQCEESFFDFAGNRDKNHDALRSVLQALKGLSGGFLTIYDQQTLYQAVKSYTVHQDRNLLRFKLNLSASQKTSLIERLIDAKQNFKSKYYFFDRNCASILFQIIGEGIASKEIAEFSELVMPPNALVAMLVRKKIATQIFPSFYSYRKKAFLAQDEIAQSSPKELRSAIVSKSEKARLKAWKSLYAKQEYKIQPADYLQLSSLGQDAELAYMDRGQRCENYTSSVTTFLRNSQRIILANTGPKVKSELKDTNDILDEKFRQFEIADNNMGTKNTKLSSISIKLLRKEARNSARMGYALHRQQSGSISSLAMQRGTSIVLGEVEYERPLAHPNEDQPSWGVKVLDIKKFKERLYHIPPFLSENGKIGIGLRLLHLDKDFDKPYIESKIAGGSVLFNLFSNRLNLDYLYTSVGADLDGLWYKNRTGKIVPSQLFLSLPVYSEGLWTISKNRLWQLRFSHLIRYKILAPHNEKQTTTNFNVQYRAPNDGPTEFLVSLFAKLHDSYPTQNTPLTNSYGVGLEWNRW